jgi:DNA-binding transcriptional regulator GbsR (MarR family)
MTAARVMSYLLLQARPMSLDEIAEGMGISKAGAWGATKHLEQVNEIERFSESGTKRVLFAVAQDPAEAIRKYSRVLRKAGDLMREAASIADSPTAARRLRERSRLYLTVFEAIESAAAEFKPDRRMTGSD